MDFYFSELRTQQIIQIPAYTLGDLFSKLNIFTFQIFYILGYLLGLVSTR